MYSETETGIPIPSRVLIDGECPGRLWGLGYDPKGQLGMVQLDDGRSIEVRPERLCLENGEAGR